MSITIEDLRPKSFKIDIRGVVVECKPLRLSHTLAVAKIGEVLKESRTSTREQMKQAEKDMDAIIEELMPDLKGIELDMADTLTVITQMMETVTPADNKFLADKGVQFDTDPKVEKIG